jgi:subtilisin
MSEESTKVPGGVAPPAARVVDQGKRQFIIAPRRGSQAWSAGLRPMSAGAVRAVISQIPGLEVARVVRRRRLPGPLTGPEETSGTYVVQIDPDRAELLRQTLPPHLLLEEDVALEYGTPAVTSREAPARLSAWSTGGAIETRPIRLRVVGDSDKPVPNAGVMLTGEGFPQEGRTDRRGEVTVPLITLPGGRARSLLVTSPHSYWDEYLTGPDLSDAEVNVVRLRTLEDTIGGFPDRVRYGWGQVEMGLDRIPETLTGKGIRIAIVDSGADTSHALLRHIGIGVDLTSAAEPLSWTRDVVGHGTHCAGILAARDDSGRMLRGFVPDAEIHVLKVFPGGQFSNLLEALEYCVALEVDLVNLSLGASRRSQAVEQALEEAALQGVACVVAAGNGGGPVQYPASSPYTLAVAAVGRLDAYPDRTWDATTAVPGLVAPDGIFVPSFSPVGPEIGVCAPGVAIVSTVPGGFEPLSGASMAAPHVTGLAALLLAHHPLFQGPLRSRGLQRVTGLFNMIRSLCVPYGFGPQRIGAGLPRLHGLERVLRPHVPGHEGRPDGSTRNGESTVTAAPPMPAPAMVGVPPLAPPYAVPVFASQAPGALVTTMVDPRSGAPVYVSAPGAVHEWPFHALLESLRQQYGAGLSSAAREEAAGPPPGPSPLRAMTDDDYMDVALGEAEDAFARGDWPVGCVVPMRVPRGAGP